MRWESLKAAVYDHDKKHSQLADSIVTCYHFA
jgi:hypothetical protein